MSRRPSLTRAVLCGAVVLLGAASAGAQAPSPPVPVQDNSFLIEEAYNQEPHVVQHIGTMQRTPAAGVWAFSFTQEWPVGSRRHQLSATVPVTHVGDDTVALTGLGDLLLNYRYQLVGGGGPVAVAPRISLVLPTGRVADGLGAGAAGVQLNLPVSVELPARLVTHVNAGTTYTPNARNAAGATANTAAFNLGQSVIWLATPTLNVLLEAVWNSAATVAATDVTERESSFVLAPGVRYAVNLGRVQVVPGAAYVVGAGPSAGERSVFTYLSVEHPF